MKRKTIAILLSAFVVFGILGLTSCIETKNQTTEDSTAKNDPIRYAITYGLDGGVLPDNALTSFSRNDLPYVLLEPTKDGFTFNGWFIDSEFKNLITEISVETQENITLYAKWVENSFIEKEQPELSEETKALIKAYQNNPSDDSYLALRNSVIASYNSVLAHKEAKLAELKEEILGKPNGEAIVAEMDEIVQDMYITYWEHINSTMLRFTDRRLAHWNVSTANQYEYVPVMGAGTTVEIKRTPVTNAEYKAFIDDTKYTAPSNWINNNYPAGEDDYPVNFVSYNDALEYCSWLTTKDGTNTYRLPNESEWELVAGHMPKDADFNAGNINDGRTSVFLYDGITRGAHGAIDFWGNVWEWTSTIRDTDILAVKGGSFQSNRTECRTEHRKEGRNFETAFEDVGFRVVKIKNGIEPKQKVELSTLDAPAVTATLIDNNILLSWNEVSKAVEYQIFEYNTETKLFRMLETTKEKTYTINGVFDSSKYKYVVQAISYVEFSDNVAEEYAIAIY